MNFTRAAIKTEFYSFRQRPPAFLGLALWLGLLFGADLIISNYYLTAAEPISTNSVQQELQPTTTRLAMMPSQEATFLRAKRLPGMAHMQAICFSVANKLSINKHLSNVLSIHSACVVVLLSVHFVWR